MGTWIYILMIILVFAARFALDKLIDTTSSKVRFSMTLLLMVMYTIFLEGFIYITRDQLALTNKGYEEFYQSIVVGIALINFALLIVAVVYYFVRKKRKMSDMDKVKLKDL